MYQKSGISQGILDVCKGHSYGIIPDEGVVVVRSALRVFRVAAQPGMNDYRSLSS